MKVVSLFSGCGGLDLGFIQAGHQIIWANDFDKNAVDTYKHNIGNHITHDSILNIEVSQIPDCDIITGGFPCQGFSLAGKRQANDVRNFLYLELLRVIKGKKPKFFVAENVQGIMSLDNGRIFEMILADMRACGYNVSYKLFNCADYGVPQIRKRVIFFGVREDIDFEVEFPEPTHSKNNSDLLTWVTVRTAIGDLPLSENSTIPNHTGTKHKVIINGYVGNRATQWEEPSPTIMGRGGGTGGPVIIPHPELHRRMTVREVARIQTFPDDFIFMGSVSSQYRQIGNAVPPVFAKFIGEVFPIN